MTEKPTHLQKVKSTIISYKSTFDRDSWYKNCRKHFSKQYTRQLFFDQGKIDGAVAMWKNSWCVGFFVTREGGQRHHINAI